MFDTFLRWIRLQNVKMRRYKDAKTQCRMQKCTLKECWENLIFHNWVPQFLIGFITYRKKITDHIFFGYIWDACMSTNGNAFDQTLSYVLSIHCGLRYCVAEVYHFMRKTFKSLEKHFGITEYKSAKILRENSPTAVWVTNHFMNHSECPFSAYLGEV